VHHARNALGVGRSLRRPKRYNVVDSPLTALHWWRLILDEAQNVGDGFSQVMLLPSKRISGMCCGQLRKHVPIYVMGHKDSAGLGQLSDIPMHKHVLPRSSVTFWRFKETCSS
jgi:hypothetical protein